MSCQPNMKFLDAAGAFTVAVDVGIYFIQRWRLLYLEHATFIFAEA